MHHQLIVYSRGGQCKMHHHDTEGEFDLALTSHAGAFSSGEHDCARESWGGLVDEAQAALRVPLDEMALLASTVTAETATQRQPYTPATPVRSAYSLLLEPALLKFPA
jgi:hypothetical protein